MNNVEIKDFSKDCLDKTFEWINDPMLRKDFLLRKNVTQEDHLTWYENVIKNESQKIFGIYSDGKHCGNCGLKFINITDRKAELWIYIGDKNQRGKGIAKTACKKLLDYSFNVLNLQKVYLHVASFNKDAINLYKNLKFEEEGFFKNDFILDGESIDIIRLFIFSDEFNKQNTEASGK
jgi:diamine N-acetyltransferase